ncbi:hypothetical protein JL722_10831 [Aureococcus anophagefferens]|nr:hypothetical protein JL722_10831 [Aureococcus anophagefferens]
MHRFVLLMVKTGAGAATTGAAAAAARIVFPAPYAVNVGGDALVDVLVEGPDPAPAELWVDGVRACPAPGACDSDVCPDGRAGEVVVLRVAPPRPALNIGQWHLDPGSFGDSADWRRLAAKADNLRYFTTLRLNGALGCASLAPALAQILVDAAFFDAESLGPDGDWVTAASWLPELRRATRAVVFGDACPAGVTRTPSTRPDARRRAALSRVQKALTFRVPAALAFEALGAAGFEGLGGRSRDAAFAKVSDSDEAASVTFALRAARARALGAVWRVGGELWAHGAAPTDAPSNSWSACFVEELDGTRQFHDYLDDEGARGALVGLKGLLEAALALARARAARDAFFFTGRRLADLAALAASDPPVVNGRVVVRRRAGVAGDDKTAGGWDSFRDLLFYLNATVAYVVYRNGAACVAGRRGTLTCW